MWTLVAISLYLLPLVAFLGVRRSWTDQPIGRALEVPIAVGGDLLFILLIARCLVLDYAVFVARALELAALAWLVVRRRRSLPALSRASLVRALTAAPLWAALLAVWVSRLISVPYAIWDRHWHMPLVASLRGQYTPFENVYEPGTHFFYHYLGNALAAIFQALSFAHLHASAALSRSHDVIFGVTGAFIALALGGLGVRRSALQIAAVLMTLLAGPATVLYEGARRWTTGHSLINALSLSFRPHEPLSFLFAASLLVAGLAPLLLDPWQRSPSARFALPIAASGLSLTDEPTLALIVGTLAVAWVLAPRALAGSWSNRLFMVLVPLAAVLVTLLVFGGTFSIGAPKQAIALVPPRVPGFYSASVPLRDSEAFAALIVDNLGPVTVGAAAILSAFALPSARGFVLLAAHWAFLAASFAILVFVKVNHDDTESHRAVTGIMVLSPLLLMLWYSRLPSGGACGWVLGVGGLGCVFGLVSTVDWIRGVAPDETRIHKPYWGDDMFYETDCVAMTGARLGERAMLSIGPRDRWNLFAGCRPVYAPNGGTPGGHAIAVGWPDVEATVFDKAAAWLPRFGQLRIFLPQHSRENAPFRRRVSRRDLCRPAGSEFVECLESAEQFKATGSSPSG